MCLFTMTVLGMSVMSKEGLRYTSEINHLQLGLVVNAALADNRPGHGSVNQLSTGEGLGYG